jgi:hypothetical protein
MKKYVERLYKEWSQYGKIVIAVDFDSTIYPWPTIDNKEDRERVISILQVASNTGAYIVINTCSSPDRHVEIQDYCEKIKLPIDGINTNPIELPYGNHGKMYANIYLDDRAGLVQSLDILEQAMYLVRGNKMKNLTNGESI